MQGYSKITENMNSISQHKKSTSNMTKSIAEQFFRDLKENGFADRDIVAVSSEILNKLTEDIKNRNT